MIRNNGRPLTQATSSGDGSRCGQAINGPAYAGLSNAGYGTLMIGRQNTLDLELVANYDPMGASYAFSLIGWSGGAGPGTGSTETARWDNSIKYLYQYGPVHVGAMYAVGAEDSSIFNSAYAFNAGGTYKGFSVDVVYTKENGAFNAGAPYPYQGAGTCGVAGMPACNTLTGNFEDNEAWTIAGKYVYDFGGGWKDEGPAAKLTLYGGYQHTNISNPGNPIGITGNTTIGGYPLFFTSFAAANQVFTTDKVIQTEWVGAKYELPSGWSFTGAYYHLDQNSFVKSGAACVPGSGTHASSNCAGDTNTVSGLVDYAFNKHFDVYGGVAWSDVSGGLASGFLATENTTVVTGMRLKF
jgi:predicted porin